MSSLVSKTIVTPPRPHQSISILLVNPDISVQPFVGIPSITKIISVQPEEHSARRGGSQPQTLRSHQITIHQPVEVIDHIGNA